MSNDDNRIYQDLLADDDWPDDAYIVLDFDAQDVTPAVVGRDLIDVLREDAIVDDLGFTIES